MEYFSSYLICYYPKKKVLKTKMQVVRRNGEIRVCQNIPYTHLSRVESIPKFSEKNHISFWLVLCQRDGDSCLVLRPAMMRVVCRVRLDYPKIRLHRWAILDLQAAPSDLLVAGNAFKWVTTSTGCRLHPKCNGRFFPKISRSSYSLSSRTPVQRV